jgi:hypothetical protein
LTWKELPTQDNLPANTVHLQASVSTTLMVAQDISSAPATPSQARYNPSRSEPTTLMREPALYHKEQDRANGQTFPPAVLCSSEDP